MWIQHGLRTKCCTLFEGNCDRGPLIHTAKRRFIAKGWPTLETACQPLKERSSIALISFTSLKEDVNYFPMGPGNPGLPSYIVVKAKSSWLIKSMTLISAENNVYSLISTQQIEKGIKQQKPWLLGASELCLNFQSDMSEILLFEMTVSWSGLE